MSLLLVKLPAESLQHAKSFKNLNVQFLSKSTLIFTNFIVIFLLLDFGFIYNLFNINKHRHVIIDLYKNKLMPVY